MDNMMAKCQKIDKFDTRHLSKAAVKRKRVMDRLKRNNLKKDIEAGKKHVADLFTTDREILTMREIFTKEFYSVWIVGM